MGSKKSGQEPTYLEYVVVPKNVEVKVLASEASSAAVDPLAQETVNAASAVATELGHNWVGVVDYNAGWNLRAVCRDTGKISIAVFFNIRREAFHAILTSDGSSTGPVGVSEQSFANPRDAVRDAVAAKRTHLRQEQAYLDDALDALI